MPPAVLSPQACREMRELISWTFTDLSRTSGVSRAQLCCFENKHRRGNLRPDQLERIDKALLRGMREQQMRIAKLVGGEKSALRQAAARKVTAPFFEKEPA